MNYLLVGQEEYLKQQFTENLKKTLLEKQKSRPDFEVFIAGTKEITSLLESSDTLPFASSMRLIAIKDIDKFSQKEKKSILKYLKAPRDSTIFLLESQSPWVNNKFLEEISKFARTVACNKLKESELEPWIKKEFASRGKKISLPLTRLISERIGSSLFLLKNEIEKITAFLGAEDEVTQRHIEEICGKGFYKSSFELVELVMEKKAEKVLDQAEAILASGEKPHQILNLLAWQFRNFLKIKNLPKGASRRDIAGCLDIQWRFIDKALKQAGRFTRRELETNLEIILEADFSVKSGRLEARLTLEGALLRLCGAA